MEYILLVRNYKHGDDVNSEVTTDMFFYTLIIAIRKLFIKMKTIFFCFCTSVDNESISLKFRL